MSMDIQFRKVSARRGGVSFDTTPITEIQQLINEQMRRLNERIVATSERYRSLVIETAVAYAATHGYDVHITEPPAPFSMAPNYATNEILYRLRYVGIEFTPGKYPVPTLHFHAADADEFVSEMAWEARDLEHWLDFD